MAPPLSEILCNPSYLPDYFFFSVFTSEMSCLNSPQSLVPTLSFVTSAWQKSGCKEIFPLDGSGTFRNCVPSAIESTVANCCSPSLLQSPPLQRKTVSEKGRHAGI